MRGFASRLDRFLYLVIAAMLAVMVLDVTVQVIFRYIVKDPPVWTEELARYLFTWQIFLAAAIGFSRGSHMVIDALLIVVPRPVRRWMLVASNTLVFAFLLVLVWQGINMVGVTSNMKSATLELNMGIVYAALPISAAISAMYVLLALVDLLREPGSLPQTQVVN